MVFQEAEVGKVRAEILRYGGELSGIRLTATNREEKDILRRFFDGGVKPNALHEGKELHLTFADLIQKSRTQPEEPHKFTRMVATLIAKRMFQLP